MSDFRRTAASGDQTTDRGTDTPVVRGLPPVPAPRASVSYGARRWDLADGDDLVVGRGSACQVRIGHAPRPDPMVSRRSAQLVVWEGTVLVRNLSRTQPLYVRVDPGPERLVEPGEVFAPARGRYQLVVLGTTLDFGHAPVEHVVEVAAEDLVVLDDVIDLTQENTTPGSHTLTRADRRMLAALCEPMLTGRGPGAVPRTADQIARRLDTSPGYVYNRLRQIRIKLTSQGVPGLVEDPGQGQRGGDRDFAQPLAAWAIRSLVVAVKDVTELLPPIVA